MKRRILTLLLTLGMVLSLLPGTALAVNDSSAPAVTYADLADINGTALVPDGAGENTELTVADAVRALLLWTGMTEQQLGSFPVFVKPCSQGSSVGVAKANNLLELAEGLTDFGFDCNMYVFARDGFAPFREEYKAACINLGRRVTFDLPDGSQGAGEAVDVDAEGRLVVRTDAGEQHVFTGEVSVHGIYGAV